MPKNEEKDSRRRRSRGRSRSRRRSRSDRDSNHRKSLSRSTSRRSHGNRSRRDRYAFDNNLQLKIMERLESLEQKITKGKSESPRPPILKAQQRIALPSNPVMKDSTLLRSPASQQLGSDASVLTDSEGDSEKIDDEASTNSTNEEEEMDLEINAPNEDLLSALGLTPEGARPWGPPIAQGLIDRWAPILTTGLVAEARGNVVGAYKIPENFLLLGPPKLNPELEGLMVADGKKKDEAIVGFQRQVASGITAVGNVITRLIASGPASEIMKETCSGLGDSARILLDLHHSMSIRRRLAIVPTMSAGSVVRKTAETSILDSALFGQDFAQRVKVAKELEKTTSELQPKRKQNLSGKRGSGGVSAASSAPSYKRSYLNSKRPPTRKPPYQSRRGSRRGNHRQ